MTPAKPEEARQEIEVLERFNVIYDGDKAKAFLEWAREHAERLYPDVGMRSYVVPPLFVHKHSLRYDPSAGADVLQETQKSSPKGEKAHRIVAKSFSLLSPKLSKPIFLISGLEYDNLLKWVRHHPDLAPALPDAVEKRGDIDIMLIHPLHGLVFIQVKAVGDNAESKTQAEVRKKIVLGGRQLEKDANILRWVMKDSPGEAAKCHVTRVVALPNLTREEIASFWPPADLDPESEEAKKTEGVLFLCKDDLSTLEEMATAEADADVTSLMTWWQEHVAVVDAPLSQAFLKDLVSRYVGMLSAVEVYAGNNLRKEVRVMRDAVDVLGLMFRRILLNEQQLNILSAPCQRRYLSGPPGSGKTVILMLKARQFVQQGGHVVVINMYRGAAGRAIGHFIREGVARFRVPQTHDGKKTKCKSKTRKKKGEEKAASVDLTPPLPRKRIDTPPTRGPRNGTENTRARSKSSCTTLPSSRKGESPVMSPDLQRQRQDSGATVEGESTPHVLRENTNSPTSPRKTGSPGPPNSRKDLAAASSRDVPEVDVSDRVHCVDVDISVPAFNRARFEADIRACLPTADVTSADVMFVVDEIYVMEYWISVLEVVDKGFPGCLIWCAGLYSGNPAGFEQENLLHVLRCPPLVLKVLDVVDWVPERKECYRMTLDAASSGVYTAGLNPLSIRHRDHPPVSVTECELCATQLAELLFQGLGLRPPCPPSSTRTSVSCDSSADAAASSSSSSLGASWSEEGGGGGPGGEAWRVSCGDVVVLVNLPRALYGPDERGFLEATLQDFAAYLAYLDACPLVAALRRAGLPVRVVKELPCLDLHDRKGCCGDEEVDAVWAYAYQGLENKVVVYLPGDTPWRSDPWRSDPYPPEIPAPGLRAAPREVPTTWTPVKAPPCAPRCQGSRPCSGSAPESGKCFNLSEYWWREEDVRERYSNWDKCNLFVAGSRCLSQLIMIVP